MLSLLSCVQFVADVPLDAVNSFDRNATRDENRSSPLKGEQILDRLKEIVIDSLHRVSVSVATATPNSIMSSANFDPSIRTILLPIFDT
jgi:hypothetical protein